MEEKQQLEDQDRPEEERPAAFSDPVPDPPWGKPGGFGTSYDDSPAPPPKQEKKS